MERRPAGLSAPGRQGIRAQRDTITRGPNAARGTGAGSDIVFAIDSILVAVALSPKVWVVITGGILGIVKMRLLIGTILGVVRRYPGGYSDWLTQGGELAVAEDPTLRQGKSVRRGAAATPTPRRAAPARLSYKEQRELDGLGPRIEALEREIAGLESRVTAADFYPQPWESTAPVLDELQARQAEHEQFLARWIELDDRRRQLTSSADAAQHPV